MRAFLIVAIFAFAASAFGQSVYKTAFSIGDKAFVIHEKTTIHKCPKCDSTIKLWVCSEEPVELMKATIFVAKGSYNVIYKSESSAPIQEGNLFPTLEEGKYECNKRNGVEQPVRLTSPLLIPWIEVNQSYSNPEQNEAQIVNCVAGVEYWKQITNAIVVSTVPGQEWLYTELKHRLPNIRVIPGIKTNDILGNNNFDSIEGWQQLAQSIATAMKTSGETVVVLENETALGSYWRGEYDINFDQLRKGLSYLPDNVQILWYPTLLANDAQRSRCIPLMKVIMAEIDCRLVDLTMCDPVRNNAAAKQALTNLAGETIPMPIIYVGRLGQHMYWPYGRIYDILALAKERTEILIYPGSTNWVLAAKSISESLEQKGDPKDPDPDPKDPNKGSK